jgi:hypothetical protein
MQVAAPQGGRRCLAEGYHLACFPVGAGPELRLKARKKSSMFTASAGTAVFRDYQRS